MKGLEGFGGESVNEEASPMKAEVWTSPMIMTTLGVASVEEE